MPLNIKKKKSLTIVYILWISQTVDDQFLNRLLKKKPLKRAAFYWIDYLKTGYGTNNMLQCKNVMMKNDLL